MKHAHETLMLVSSVLITLVTSFITQVYAQNQHIFTDNFNVSGLDPAWQINYHPHSGGFDCAPQRGAFV